jgi:hypothetical protein
MIAKRSFSVRLTIDFLRAHNPAAAGIPAVGIGVPESRRTSRQHRGFFHVRQHGTPVFGRAVRGAFGLAGSLTRYANSHGSALPIGVGAAVR